MIVFTCRFADVNVEIHALFAETKAFCQEYLTDGTPDFTVSVTAEDILYERKMSEKSSLQEFGRVIPYPDSYLETLAVYRQIAEQMLQYQVILMHGSVIAVDDVCYMFTAKSGTGKSTHSRLWREYFGERAYMVNDDKPLIRLTENGPVAYGTPWDGKHHLSRNIGVPLKAICQLNRAEENQIASMSIREAFPIAVQQVYCPRKQDGMQKLLPLLEQLLKNTKWYRLGCNMDLEAAKVSYEGMQ